MNEEKIASLFREIANEKAGFAQLLADRKALNAQLKQANILFRSELEHSKQFIKDLKYKLPY